MKNWKTYQIVLFIASVIFFIGYILDLGGLITFGKNMGSIFLLLFTLSTAIYLFEREKIASILFVITSVLILVALIF